MAMDNDYLESIKKQFQYYKMLGDKTFEQLSKEAFFWQFNEDSNSIAIIVNHLSGNMLSRFTDFLSSDGEKEWRNRDAEFEVSATTKQEVLALWEKGWNCFLHALTALTDEDLGKIVYIRNQGHTVTEALNRQLAHYPYHIGQIVMLGKMLAQQPWQSLSIPKGGSKTFNDAKFSQAQQKAHFTDEFLNQKTDEPRNYSV